MLLNLSVKTPGEFHINYRTITELLRKFSRLKILKLFIYQIKRKEREKIQKPNERNQKVNNKVLNGKYLRSKLWCKGGAKRFTSKDSDIFSQFPSDFISKHFIENFQIIFIVKFQKDVIMPVMKASISCNYYFIQTPREQDFFTPTNIFYMPTRSEK